MTYSSTASLCDTLALFGNTPADVLMTFDAPDQEDSQALTARMMDALMTLCVDTCSELDSQDLLWNIVNIFHAKAMKLEREIDAKMLEIQKLSREQDGSEIASGQLEEVTDTAHGLQRRLTGAEVMREAAAKHFEEMTGDAWAAKRGSRRAQGALTAAMMDAKDIEQTRRRKKNEIDMPEGEKIVVTGGLCRDYNRLYAYLDKIKAGYDADSKPMVLLHLGQAKGVDKIASTWASNRNVPQVAYKPNWGDGNKAGFNRNEKLLKELPNKVIIINSSSGVLDNLADKARKMGIITVTQQEEAPQQQAA